jgi:hypothetical protein
MLDWLSNKEGVELIRIGGAVGALSRSEPELDFEVRETDPELSPTPSFVPSARPTKLGDPSSGGTPASTSPTSCARLRPRPALIGRRMRDAAAAASTLISTGTSSGISRRNLDRAGLREAYRNSVWHASE